MMVLIISKFLPATNKVTMHVIGSCPKSRGCKRQNGRIELDFSSSC